MARREIALDDDFVRERLGALLPAARAFAVASLNPVDEAFHTARVTHDELSSWDFFVTIGGVSVAVSCLSDRVSARRFAELLPRLREQLDAWDPQASAALEDCRAFITRSLQGKLSQGDPGHPTITDALGMWILWNLYGRCPSYEESAPARTIGGMLEQAFAGWWDSG